MGAESIQGAVLAKDARRARTAARGRSLLRARALLRGRAALLCAAAAAALAGCGGAGEGRPPQLGVRAGDDEAAAKLGFPAAATRNTVRVGGGDAVADAAAVARIFYPAATTATRPRAVVLIDSRRWQDAVSAAPLAGDPLAAPLLFATGGDIPAVTRDALASLRPLGSDLADDAQVIVVGDVTPAPANLRIRRLRGEDPYAVAAEIDRFAATVRRKPSPRVVIFSGERPEWAMPAAAWAAFSGDAALPVRATTVPAPIRRALARREGEAQIFLLGPESVLPRALERKLRSFGRVRRVGARARSAVDLAIAFARYRAGGFGWGVVVPGYNLTLANVARPLDAAAAALLATKGVFAPLLLTDRADTLPRALQQYLLSIQPGYEGTPQDSVYNRVWILGDDRAVSIAAQAQLDRLVELVPVQPQAP